MEPDNYEMIIIKRYLNGQFEAHWMLWTPSHACSHFLVWFGCLFSWMQRCATVNIGAQNSGAFLSIAQKIFCFMMNFYLHFRLSDEEKKKTQRTECDRKYDGIKWTESKRTNNAHLVVIWRQLHCHERVNELLLIALTWVEFILGMIHLWNPSFSHSHTHTSTQTESICDNKYDANFFDTLSSKAFLDMAQLIFRYERSQNDSIYPSCRCFYCRLLNQRHSQWEYYRNESKNDTFKNGCTQFETLEWLHTFATFHTTQA